MRNRKLKPLDENGTEPIRNVQNKNQIRHKRQRRVVHRNDTPNKQPSFSYFGGGRPGYLLPTTYPELMYKRRNGRTKFEQAVRKKRVLNLIVGVAAAIIIVFLLMIAITIATILVLKYKNGSTQVTATISGNFSKVYISTDSSQISNIFFQIVQRSVSANSSLYLSFVDYNAAYNNAKSRYLSNNSISKRNVFSDSAVQYYFVASLEKLMKSLNWESKGFYLDGEFVSILSYLNNVAVISTSFTDLETMMLDLYNKSMANDLDMNLNGTKW